MIRARSAPLISPSHIARTRHTLTELMCRNVAGSVAVDGREPVPEPKQGVHPSARCDTDRGARGLGALLTAGLHQQVVLGAARGRTRQGRRRAHHRTRAGARRTRRRGRHHSQVRRRRILRLRRSLRRNPYRHTCCSCHTVSRSSQNDYKLNRENCKSQREPSRLLLGVVLV